MTNGTTKERLLDAAERLFGEAGYAATSLRHVIAAAGVNLASIHYHFGSKEALLIEIVKRKITPVNEARLRRLDELEAMSGSDAPAVEDVLDALLRPAFLARRENPDVVRLMGRILSEGLMRMVGPEVFGTMILRFEAALQKALPEVPPEELRWKIHFMIGAMAHALCGPPELRPGTPEEDPGVVCARLVAFLAAGFKAPMWKSQGNRRESE
jgi:AcrR family transcriptional regulator